MTTMLCVVLLLVDCDQTGLAKGPWMEVRRGGTSMSHVEFLCLGRSEIAMFLVNFKKYPCHMSLMFLVFVSRR